MSVKIDKEKCNLCGQCINMCIMRQIKIENNDILLIMNVMNVLTVL